MNELSKEVPGKFPNDHFIESCHVCLIFDSEEQRQKIIAEYLAEGLRQGELVRYFTDKTSPETVRSWFLGLGVELSEAEKKGSFGIVSAENFYFPEGKFEPRKIIDGASIRYAQAKKAGYKGTRACGEMSWALNNIPGSDHLLEYEVMLNNVDTTFPHAGICQYDSRLFDGATLYKVLQVHPYIMVHGQIVRNPFYIRSEEFLADQKNKHIV